MGGVKREASGKIIVHVFPCLTMLTLYLLTLATEQTKKKKREKTTTCFFWLKDRDRAGKSSMELTHPIVSVTVCSFVEQSGTLDLLL